MKTTARECGFTVSGPFPVACGQRKTLPPPGTSTDTTPASSNGAGMHPDAVPIAN